MKITNKVVITINPYTDACTLLCPFLNKDREIPYCGRYKQPLKILTYKPVSQIKRLWQLFKVDLKRYISTNFRSKSNRTFTKFEHVYYENIDSDTVRLYVRCSDCKKSYHSAELIGYIVT